MGCQLSILFLGKKNKDIEIRSHYANILTNVFLANVTAFNISCSILKFLVNSIFTGSLHSVKW